MFVLGRIKMLNLTDERFTVPKDFHLDDFMRHSFKVMHDELYTVKVRIPPEWGRWVGEAPNRNKKGRNIKRKNSHLDYS